MLLPRFVLLYFFDSVELIMSIIQFSDFLRFGVKYVEELYAQQPPKNAAGAWK